MDTRDRLPAGGSAFIGRARECDEIQALLDQPECRLLTLVGPGGIGKTRLALQAGAANHAAFARGTAVVYLQPVRSADFFLPVLAAALGFALSGPEPPLEQLRRYLSDREMLLILDNFEHLLAAADDFCALIAAAPRSKFLVTSREALNVRQEWLYPVPGLAFPTSPADLSAAAAYDAVQLFNERAARVCPTFSPTAETEAVVHICRLVGGMPLALELAAAWRSTLDSRAIAGEIEAGLAFLTTRLRDGSARHHSIQTVFDQTWNRLDEREQDVFRRLSVFRGGFDRAAITAVTGATLLLLSALVDKSLLSLDEHGRYQVHELLRQYAAEQLEKEPAAAAQTQADHAAYYLDFLRLRRADVSGGRQRAALLEIRTELDNIRAAWLCAVAHADAAGLYQGSEVFGLYYQFQGGFVEGMTLFTQAAQALQSRPQSEINDLALLQILIYQGWYHLRFGRPESTEACMAQVQAIYRRLAIPPLPGHMTDPEVELAFVALIRGDYDTAVAYAAPARRRAEEHDHPIIRQFTNHVLAEAHAGLGQYETAQGFAQQAYALSLSTGDRWFRAYILNTLGHIALTLGDNRMARTHFQFSYEIRAAFDDPEGMALALINVGVLARRESAYAEAVEHFQRSRAIYEDINDKGGLASANWGLGTVALAQGEQTAAQAQFHTALALAMGIGYRPVLHGLLVDSAALLWRQGQRERPLMLLAYAAYSPAAGHETIAEACARLAEYQSAVAPAFFAAAVARGAAADLDMLTAELLAQLSLPPMPAAPAAALFEPLTPREAEVLALLTCGLSNREIAEQLIIATGTVKYYTSQIYGKLGVRNRVTAVTRARELHLIP